MNPAPNPQEIGGVIHRINRLGNATEQLFRRLYQGLGQRSSAIPTPPENNNVHAHLLKSRDEEIERLNGIIAALSDGIIMQDTEGRILVVNAAARELIGSQKTFWQSELGKLFDSFKDQGPFDTELTPLGQPLKTQINNKIIGAQLAAVADSHGERIGTLIVLRDITQDTLAERLKDQFVASLSHELRTPMAVIKGMSEIMLNQPDDAKPNRRLLETVSRNVDILDRMILELLDISEITTGEFNIRRDELQLESLIWTVVNGLAPEIKRSKLNVSVMLKNVPKLNIEGDDGRLRWALGHLLQNSIHYTERGGHILITARQSDDNFIAIQVVDTGVGISETDLPKVFDRFFRGEARNTDGKLIDPRGLGQGLFIAKTVTEAHGGYLTASSSAGSGSIFTMVLPTAA